MPQRPIQPERDGVIGVVWIQINHRLHDVQLIVCTHLAPGAAVLLSRGVKVAPTEQIDAAKFSHRRLKPELDALFPPVHAGERRALRQADRRLAHEIHRHLLPVRVQPGNAGDIQGQTLGASKPWAGHSPVEGKTCHWVAVPGKTTLGFIAVSLLVLQIEVQIFQPHAVISAVLQLEPGVGGVDLQCLHADALAVQLQPAVDLIHHAAGGVRRVKGDVEGERLLRWAAGRGCHDLIHGAQALDGPDSKRDGHTVGHLIFVVEVDDIPAQLAVFFLLARRNHGKCPVACVDVAVEQGIGLRPVLILHTDEQVHLLLVHDNIFYRHGNAVFRLTLADDLHIVVLHRPAQAA